MIYIKYKYNVSILYYKIKQNEAVMKKKINGVTLREIGLMSDKEYTEFLIDFQKKKYEDKEELLKQIEEARKKHTLIRKIKSEKHNEKLTITDIIAELKNNKKEINIKEIYKTLKNKISGKNAQFSNKDAIKNVSLIQSDKIVKNIDQGLKKPIKSKNHKKTEEDRYFNAVNGLIALYNTINTNTNNNLVKKLEGVRKEAGINQEANKGNTDKKFLSFLSETLALETQIPTSVAKNCYNEENYIGKFTINNKFKNQTTKKMLRYCKNITTKH